MAGLFGTDGVRGVANVELTAELAFELGRSGAVCLTEENKHKPKILIGSDTRISCDMLGAALAAGICSVGAEAVMLGVLPTPAVAYLTRLYRADAGVVISASHNPMEYNGIKFFNGDGFKLSDEVEARIEELIKGGEIKNAVGAEIGRITRAENAIGDYEDYLVASANIRLDGKRVALDCANGAASGIAERVFKRLGAQTVVIHSEPSGVNINDGCGSTHMEELCSLAAAESCDFGFAFDGDADRMLAVDENGNILDGDKIMAICGSYLKERGRLNKNTVIATVMSNLGLTIAADKLGLEILRADVGDRYVLEMMQRGGFSLGGEQSGHLIFMDYNTTGDGLLSALILCGALLSDGRSVSEIAEIMEVLPQILVNARVKNEFKARYKENKRIMDKIGEIEKEFCNEGRVLIRPSGTEPLVRVMIEGKEKAYITARAEELARLITEECG